MLQNLIKHFYALNKRTISIQQITYIFNEMIILTERIIYIVNEIVILIQRIIFISNERIPFLQRIIYIFNQFLRIQRWTNVFLHVQRFKKIFSGFQNTSITNFVQKFSNCFLGASRKFFTIIYCPEDLKLIILTYNTHITLISWK